MVIASMLYWATSLFSIVNEVDKLTEMHPMHVKRLDCINYKGSRGADVFQCQYASLDYKMQFMADISAMEFKRYLSDPTPVEDNIMVNQIMLEGFDKRNALTSDVLVITFSAIGGLIVFLIIELFLSFYIRKLGNNHD